MRKIVKILKIFKKNEENEESMDCESRKRKMEEFSEEIQNYPHYSRAVSTSYTLKNCPCKICQLKKSISLLFT